MLNPWDPQTAPYTNNSDIYNFSFTNPTGLSANNAWTAAQLEHINGANPSLPGFNPSSGASNLALNGINQGFQYIRPDASQQANAASINQYLTNEGTARQVFGLTPGSQGSGGGVPFGSGSSAPSAGTGSSQGFSLGLGNGTSGATGGVLGGSSAAGGATAGAGASGASGGFWGAAKGVLGNKALMSGLISGLSSAYGQWQQKSLAKDQYKYQSQELERYRQWQADQAERKRNSPSAQMSRALLAYYMPIMVERLGRHGRGGDTSALQEAMRNILGQGA